MALNIERSSDVEPRVIRRACGGWLAVCHVETGLSMGVTAPTEAEARKKFGYVLTRWLEIIRDPGVSADT